MIEWRPHPGPQTDFLSCGAFEVGFGGAAGGSKSESLLMGALRHIDRPDYKGILFRRTFPELLASLIDRSRERFRGMGKYNSSLKTWTFPSGAKIVFGHLQHDDDIEDHLSTEYQYVAFDECVTFTEKQYRALIARIRSGTGIPPRLRWASNPADHDNHWLLRRYAPWLDTRESYAGPRASPGEWLWFGVDEQGDEICVPKGSPGALSRTYFPARLSDNPTLMLNDPHYASRIRAMGAVEARRYLDGDWFAREVKGALFFQEDIDRFRVSTKQAPDYLQVAVAVDPAVSDTATSDEHGILMGGVSETGHIYVEGDWSLKGSPEKWGAQVVEVYRSKRANIVVAEVNNGGDLVERNISAIDATIPVHKVHATRGKAKRLEPVATLMKRGRIHFVGNMPGLESEMRRWVPGVSKWSPNRMDALAWLVSELLPDGVTDAAEAPPLSTIEEQIDDMLEAERQRLAEEATWG